MERQLTNIIHRWKKESHVDGIIQINPFPTSQHKLIICIAYPGRMIGKGGTTVNKYHSQIRNYFLKLNTLNSLKHQVGT